MSSILSGHGVQAIVAPPPATTATVEPQATSCRALESRVVAYLHDQWRSDGRRCFLLRPGTPWISTEKFVDNELATKGGKRVRFKWHRPGIDLIGVWQMGRFSADHVAVATSRELVDGQPLVGYFDVRRK